MPQRPDKRYRPHSLQDHTQGHYQSKRNFIEIFTNLYFILRMYGHLIKTMLNINKVSPMRRCSCRIFQIFATVILHLPASSPIMCCCLVLQLLRVHGRIDTIETILGVRVVTNMTNLRVNMLYYAILQQKSFYCLLRQKSAFMYANTNHFKT